MSETTQPPKPKRRWYQFSMRTLLVVMLLLVVSVGSIGVRLNRAQKNRERIATEQAAILEAATKNKNLDGRVFFETSLDRHWLDELFDDPADDWYCGFSGNITFGDAQVRYLKELPRLQNVYLYKTKVTNAGLQELKGLTEVWRLVLPKTGVTDAGLEHLKGLPSLRRLYLVDANITDAGLEHLQELANLEILRFGYTNVSDEGIARLHQALPNCKINERVDSGCGCDN